MTIISAKLTGLNSFENFDLSQGVKVIQVNSHSDITSLFEQLAPSTVVPQKKLDNKESKPTSYSLNRANLFVDYNDLPGLYKTIFKNKVSVELDFKAHLKSKMLHLCSKLHGASKTNPKKVFEDILLLTPFIFHTIEIIVKGDFGDDAVVALVDVMNAISRNLHSIESKLSESLMEDFNTLLAIHEELLNSINGTGFPLNQYNCLLANITGRTFDADPKMEALLLTSQDVSRSYKQYYHILLEKLNLPLMNGIDEGELWGKANKTFRTYQQNIKKRREKPKSVSSCVDLYRYTYGKLRPFIEHWVAAQNVNLQFLFPQLNSIQFVNLDEYDMAPLLRFYIEKDYTDEVTPKVFKLFLETTIYHEMSSASKSMGLDLLQDVLHSLNSQAIEDGLVVNEEYLAGFIEQSKRMCRELEMTDFSVESKHGMMLTADGRETFSSSFIRVRNSIKLLETLFELHSADQADFTVAKLFGSLFWIEYHISHSVETSIQLLIKEIQPQIEELAKKKKGGRHQPLQYRLGQKRVLNELQGNLDKIAQFMKVFEEHCRPIQLAIENFQDVFLTSAHLETEQMHDQVEMLTRECSASSNMVPKAEPLPEPVVIEEPLKAKKAKAKKESKIEISPEDAALKATKMVIDEFAEIGQNGEYCSSKNVKWKTLVEEALNAGYELVRQKGGHMQFGRLDEEGKKSVLTIPRHGKKDTVSRGVVKEVRKTIHENGDKR